MQCLRCCCCCLPLSRRYHSWQSSAKVPSWRRFTTMKRMDFEKLTDKDVKEFRLMVENSNGVIDSVDELKKYNIDWTRKYQGKSLLALCPSSTKQLSQILQYCNKRRLAVVPQGGNTGLVGGGVPVHDEIVLSLEKMNKILEADQERGMISVEAGCILEVADDFLKERGQMMPLDLGAKGSCTIGGNIATNAGGIRFLRYGSLHGNVVGLEVVLADGTILDGLDKCRKDNTGYDLKQLFIGSEGTLGVITKAAILTPVLPASVNVAVFAVDSFNQINQILASVRTHLGEILSAFEFWDGQSQGLLDRHGKRLPIGKGNFYVLLETHGSDRVHDEQKLLKLIEHLQDTGLAVEGTLAQDSTQAAYLWSLREGIPEHCSREGLVIKYDVSLRAMKNMYDPVKLLKEKLEKDENVKEILGYGHCGDGNLHLNIIVDKITPELMSKIEPFIFSSIQNQGGSISAEHGMGLQKAQYLQYARTREEIALMGQIKKLLDPQGILNPYKVLPE